MRLVVVHPSSFTRVRSKVFLGSKLSHGLPPGSLATTEVVGAELRTWTNLTPQPSYWASEPCSAIKRSPGRVAHPVSASIFTKDSSNSGNQFRAFAPYRSASNGRIPGRL